MTNRSEFAPKDDDDLPGMLALAKGVAEQRFPHTMDAQIWAAEFVKLNPGADEGNMIGWFANAIMAGYDTAQHRAARSETGPLGWVHFTTPNHPDRWDTQEYGIIEFANAAEAKKAEALFNKLEAEREAAVRDAERYRWLRGATDRDWNALLRDGGHQMDAAIDAARTQGVAK
jgi:hypothetical protein